NHTAPPRTHPLPLHDALPILSVSDSARVCVNGNEQIRSLLICNRCPAFERNEGIACTRHHHFGAQLGLDEVPKPQSHVEDEFLRSEEHTSELQSPCNLVCRLL